MKHNYRTKVSEKKPITAHIIESMAINSIK